MKNRTLYTMLIIFILLSGYTSLEYLNFDWNSKKPNINDLIKVEDLMEETKDKEIREWYEGKTIIVSGTIKYMGTENSWYVVEINRDGNMYSRGGLICMFENITVEKINELRENNKGDEIILEGTFLNKDFYDYLIIGDCNISKY